MLLSVTVLCHPPVHLTLCADYLALRSLLYNANGVMQSFFVSLLHKHRHTHLVNLGHASTVGHLERERGENTTEAISI